MLERRAMQAAESSDGRGELITLPAVLDLAAADGFLDMLQKKAEQSHPLRLDASGVETLTLPCVQIILAAIKSHDRISISSPSVEFVAAFNDLGLDWTPDGEEIPEEIRDLPSEPGLTRTHEAAKGPDHLQERMEDDAMKKRILTIDDSRTMRDMLMVTLAEAGFEVIQGVDGQHGLDTLGNDRVDVVITDINMPKMDGYEVIRQLRRNPVHKTTPVLVLTTESDAEKKNLARQAGATGWMVKPFDPDQLVATIRKVCP
jgi:two-component system chemotaxis response regulator CheY